ncbi:MAG: hypothetical protein SF123_02485 [Chloroflexota bacterium]|nr:hypothetical protein [Chloroflexota bacterium]
MPTSFQIGIDWRRKGFMCWDARPTDAINRLPSPLTYTSIDFRKTGVATSASLFNLDTPYGFRAFQVETGTGVNNGFVLGQQDGTLAVNDITVFNQFGSGPYTVVMWVRGMANFIGVPFIVRVKDETGTLMFSSSPVTLTADWQKVTASGTVVGTSPYLTIECVKNNNAANVTFQIAGIMLVSGSVVPVGYNAGNEADVFDNVTAWVQDAEWFLGMHAPYQDDADDSMLRLRVKNTSRLFSPEFMPEEPDGVGGVQEPMGKPGSLRDFLRPYAPVTVRSNDGTTTRTHWSGWVESIQPKTDSKGERTAEIKAAGAMLFFEDVETSLPVQRDRRTDEIVLDLLREVRIAPPLMQSTLLNEPGHAELDRTAFLSDALLPYDFDVGQTTLAYAGDNWVRPRGPGEAGKDSFNVYRAIKDVVGAERGRFFFDRAGQGIFWDRHRLLKRKFAAATDSTFNDGMTGLAYEFAGLGEFRNEVVVTCHPRTISSSGEELLWSLDQPLTLRSGEPRKLTASYRDASENRIGGLDVHLANVTFSSGSGSIRLVAGGNRAELEVIPDASNAQVVLATCELRGTKITDFGTIDATARDQRSISLYGRRALRLNFAAIDDFDHGQSVADFEKTRRAQPSGKVSSMTLISDARDGGGPHADQLKQTIGSIVRVQETQSAHNDVYFIIGEQHRLTQAGSLLETTWFLESAADADWFIVADPGVTALDAGVLAY